MLHQSKTAKRRETPPVPYQAGMEAVAIFEYTLAAAFTTASDLIEIGTIPAGARITDASVIGTGFTAGTTADVGILTGEPGDAEDATRALTSDLLFDGQSVVNTEANAAASVCLGVAPSAAHRGLGVHLSANEAAGAKTITVMVKYIF